MDFSVEPLEFDRLKALLGRYVSSAPARELLDAIGPSVDRGILEDRQALNREARGYLRDHRIEFREIPLLPFLLSKLGLAGLTLEIEEIEAIQDFLSQVGELRLRWRDVAGDFPGLAERGRSFPDLRALAEQLGRAVRDGEISSDYSSTLKRVRKESARARDRLNRKLESILKSVEFKDQLQDRLVTIRNGRYVIPVRAEQKRGVEGIVHGSSSSGATVFMEPIETLELNNHVVRLNEEEQREVQRILGELTDRIQQHREGLEQAGQQLAETELLFGLAQYGRDFDCIEADFSDGALRLVGARHPLLEERLRSAEGTLVPLMLEMDTRERTLVISGPNAGGKTVVLKTVGLLSLMAQSGIPVPASEATVPISDCILADIGDRQSIANQLSTFSAHVLAISRMLDSATEKSLILLDEIGSSTEPSEGAALAIAVLEHFRGSGARTVATTHYNRLKMYAETTDDVRNAAMEFDETTLEPTYHLIHGLAGQSSGLKIAARLRLPQAVLKTAQEALDRSELDAAEYVDELRTRIAALEGDKQRLETEKSGFQEWRKDMERRMEAERESRFDKMEESLDALVREIRAAAADKLEVLSQEARKRFLKSLENAHAQAGRQIQQDRRDLQKTPETPVRDVPAEPPSVGSRVRISSLGVEGSVLQVLAHEVEVGVGNLRMRRPVDDLELISPPGIVLPPNVGFDASSKSVESNEINLIGCTRDEALDRLDKYLDDAFIAGCISVRIIHGFGMGVLRGAISEFLESHPHVLRFEAAPGNQGGGGVTVATLQD